MSEEIRYVGKDELLQYIIEKGVMPFEFVDQDTIVSNMLDFRLYVHVKEEKAVEYLKEIDCNVVNNERHVFFLKINKRKIPDYTLDEAVYFVMKRIINNGDTLLGIEIPQRKVLCDVIMVYKSDFDESNLNYFTSWCVPIFFGVLIKDSYDMKRFRGINDRLLCKVKRERDDGMSIVDAIYVAHDYYYVERWY